MFQHIKETLRALPAMDFLLSQDWVQDWNDRLGRETVKTLFSEFLTELRRRILQGESPDISPAAFRTHMENRFERNVRSP
jgi:hypothetical protein